MTIAERILSVRAISEMGGREGAPSAPGSTELGHLCMESAPTGAGAEEPVANPFVELLGRFMPMVQDWNQAAPLALVGLAMAALWGDGGDEPETNQVHRA